MKKLNLITIVASVFTASGALAVGYSDTSASQPAGSSGTELHAIQFTTQASECLSGGAICAAASSINLLQRI